MALDSALKRASALNIASPWRGILPRPDGTVGQPDRQVVALLYSGIAAGEFVPPEPEPEPEPTDTAINDGGGAIGFHPDMLGRRKKKKPSPEAGPPLAAASAQAESDLHTLWEAVRITNDPHRRAQAEKKRLALLKDIEKATLLRQ